MREREDLTCHLPEVMTCKKSGIAKLCFTGRVIDELNIPSSFQCPNRGKDSYPGAI